MDWSKTNCEEFLFEELDLLNNYLPTSARAVSMQRTKTHPQFPYSADRHHE